MKILYDLNSVQRLIEVLPSGGVTRDAQVLWHEGDDGPIQSDVLDSLGGWIRQGRSLAVDAGKLSAAQTAKAAAAAARTQKNNRVNAAKTFLKNLDTSSPLTAAVLTQAVNAFRVILQDLQSQLD